VKYNLPKAWQWNTHIYLLIYLRIIYNIWVKVLGVKLIKNIRITELNVAVKATTVTVQITACHLFSFSVCM